MKVSFKHEPSAYLMQFHCWSLSVSQLEFEYLQGCLRFPPDLFYCWEVFPHHYTHGQAYKGEKFELPHIAYAWRYCILDDFDFVPVGAQKEKIYFLAAFQCFGGHCKPSVQSAKSLSSSCFLKLIYRLKIKIYIYIHIYTFYILSNNALGRQLPLMCSLLYTVLILSI